MFDQDLHSLVVVIFWHCNIDLKRACSIGFSIEHRKFECMNISRPIVASYANYPLYRMSFSHYQA